MKKKIISALAGFGLIISTTSCAGKIHEKTLQNKLLSSYETCIDGQYDNDIKCMEDDLQEAINGIYSIKVSAMVLNEAKKPVATTKLGTGILFPGGYLLTAYHVVGETDNCKPIASLLKTKTGAIPLEMIVADPDMDFAFMKIDETESSKLATYNFAIGNSEDLKVGNATYLVGNAHDLGINMREGIISQLNFNQIPAGLPFDIGISNGGNAGDSGGPVLAIRDGKIELIGINSAIATGGNNLTYAVSINKILDRIKELTKGEESSEK